LEQVVFLVLAAPALWLVWHVARGSLPGLLADPPAWASWYAGACCVALVAKIPPWLAQRRRENSPPALLASEVRLRDVRRELGHLPAGGLGRLLACVGGNESWQLAIEHKSLWIDALPPTAPSLTITHLSDLHFTGRIGPSYFNYVVDAANELASDLICLTGDIVDKRHCLPWLQPILGRLRARYGVYYVLGNHDRRPGEEQVRRELSGCGLVDLGGRSLRLRAGQLRLLLAGDERPWFGGAPPLDAEQADLRLLLAHTPDRYPWARQQKFDLMLAGHTHGGQVRLPLVGAVVSPSIYGTQYASGVFDEPPTVMHVSRGVSGEQPLRWNCPPEITQLTLVGQPAWGEAQTAGAKSAASSKFELDAVQDG
jgi:predicted MPP superfamily phosphohydrolase